VTSGLFDTGGCRLFVQSAGAGHPVVFGHSLTFDGDMWAAQQRALSGRFRTHAVDLRGHGRSDSPPGPYDLDLMADDVARLLDRLEIERTGYCGLSMGGMVGMRLALRHPDRVRALVLMNTSAEAEPAAKRALYEPMIESTRNQPAMEPMVQGLLSLMFSPGFREQHPDRVAPYYDKLNVPGHDGMYWASKAVITRPDISAALSALDVPTLVVTSDGDTAIASQHTERLAACIPNARIETISGAGHMTAVEAPDRVSGLLAEFFTETLKADRP